MRLWTFVASPFVIASALIAAPASAQDADAAAVAAEPGAEESNVGIEELIVTAQRREQSLQSVPISVSAISAENLERQQASSSLSLVRLFPNLSGGEVSALGGAANYSMRGLSTAETVSTFDVPIGTYIDGIFIARLNASNFALFDVERIEVLRGPQGTLFGRNSTGGAINVILEGPSSEFGGNVEAVYGNYDHIQVRGAINVPLSDNARARIAAYRTTESGWARNLTTGGTNNDNDNWGVRAAFEFDIGSNITWNIAGDYTEDFNANIPVRRVDGRWVTRSGLQELGSIVANHKGTIPGNFAGNYSAGLTSNLSIDTEIGNIAFITGYRHLRTRFNLDYFDNPAPTGGFMSVQESAHAQFSQEVKLSGDTLGGRLNYTAGMFYFSENNITDFTSVLTRVGNTPFIDADRILYNTTDALAFYAQLDFKLTETLTFTAGGRMTWEHKDLSFQDNGNPLASTVITNDLLVNAGVPLAQDVGVFTPRFALQYEPNEDLMFYVSATRGFKSGGWNVRGTAPTTLRDFGEETIWSYEAGARIDFFDRRARLNITGFYGLTNDLQVTAGIIGANGAPLFPVGNYSDFESYGLEVEAQVVPTRGLTIFANVGINKTRYLNLTDAVISQQGLCLGEIAGGGARPNCGQGIVRLDGTIADPFRAPEFTGTLGFSWEIPLGDTLRLVPSGSVRRVSSYNANTADLPVTEDDGYVMFSGGIALETQDGRVSFSLSCENCNDTTYLSTSIAGYNYVNSPRRIYGRLRYNF